MKSDFISINQLTMRIAGKTILQKVNCSIAQSRLVAIVGANGSGKSTLLKLISGICQPTSGKLQINDLNHAIKADALKIKATLGYAPDLPPLYTHDSVYDYLRFIAELKKIPKAKVKIYIDNCLNLLDLTKVQNNFIGTLSRGTQQRVNLAQAIINTPSLLVLDEPTNGLDAQQSVTFVQCIKHLQQQHQTTVIIASHSYNEIIPVCDSMFKINSGSLEKLPLPHAAVKIKDAHDTIHHTA